jgi:hypothetical protein
MVCLLANCLGLTAILGFATNDKSLGLLALDAEAEIAIEFLPEAGTRYACQRDTARRDLRLERRHRPASQGSAFSLVAGLLDTRPPVAMNFRYAMIFRCQWPACASP